MQQRIYKAINEGINKALIDFDDHNGLNKTKPRQHDLKEFHFGDYVYYDSILGYNNYVGDKIAICLNDGEDTNLYVMLQHKLKSRKFKWAKENSDLETDRVATDEDGWENTLHIISKYGDQLKGTLWNWLGPNEYIPSINEMYRMYDICQNNNELWDILGLKEIIYWTSSLSSGVFTISCIRGIDFRYGVHKDVYKSIGLYNSIVFLHIDN